MGITAPDERGAGARLLLPAFLVSGASSLIYEVTWTRALSLVLGSTTYAVSTMLATFLGGLALGAHLGGRRADRGGNLVLAFGLCELGIAVAGIVSVPLIHSLPGAYLALFRALHGIPVLFFCAQMALCVLVMLLPTTLMGATFPLVSRATTTSLERMGSRVGAAYTLNTVGAVFGSVLGGFVLIPTAGLTGAVIAAGALNLLVGVTMTAAARAGRRASVLILAAAFLPAAAWALAAGEPPRTVSYYSAYRHLRTGSLREIEAGERRAVSELSERHYAEGSVRALRAEAGNLIVQVGGKPEGTSVRDVQNTLLLAYLPVSALPEPPRVLVIGLGAGVTLAAARESGRSVDLIEINPGVVEAVRRFGPPGVLDGVGIRLNDARNELMRASETWDVITSEPSYPTDAAAANLFTREFYGIAAKRLPEEGVFCQWLPYYFMDNDDVTMMLRTFTASFPHALLWKVPGTLDLILLGSKSPFRRSPQEIASRARAMNWRGIPLEFVLSRGDEEIQQIVRSEPGELNTDDRPLLEFSVARNLLAEHVARNLLAEHVEEGAQSEPGRATERNH
ncbi:MAG: fused MFS/spermidine synthase [Myxococcales bacterium]|nr:fused MFS/spermidine synthase [Myxococcales bacterium]